MPNSYYGDRLKMLKPERLDVFHVPYGDFISVTGSGIGCTFGDKVRNLYTTNLFLSGHHTPATGFLDHGSGVASTHGTYRGQWGDENGLLSGNNAEWYYYNNKLYYTGQFESYQDGVLKFQTPYSEKNVVMSTHSSGSITKVESTIVTGDGITSGWNLPSLHPHWTGDKRPKDENYLLVNISEMTRTMGDEKVIVFTSDVTIPSLTYTASSYYNSNYSFGYPTAAKAFDNQTDNNPPNTYWGNGSNSANAWVKVDFGLNNFHLLVACPPSNGGEAMEGSTQRLFHLQ